MSRRLRERANSAPAPAAPPPSKRRQALAAMPVVQPPRAPRTLTVGTGSIVSVIVLMLLLAGWGTGMTLMLIFGDNMSQKLITQTSEMQDAYEQRLQAFRAEIARLSVEMEQSRFDQTSVEGRVLELGRRQRQIEARLVILSRLAEMVAPGVLQAAPVPSGGGARPGPAPAGGPPAIVPPTPPRRTRFEAVEPAIRFAGLSEADAQPVVPAQFLAPADPTDSDQKPDQPYSPEVEQFIERMDLALKRADQTQTNALAAIVRLSEYRIERLRGALTEIGMSPEVALQPQKGRPEPRIPQFVLPLNEQNGPIAKSVERIRQNFGLVHRMRYLVDALPITRPTPAEIRYSSPFGYRKHPISGVQKLHGGVDMAAPLGTPITAAGSGVVLSAGWGGGYGNLVQIDHGNGIITRYAHLSQIDVAAGQPIAVGAKVGLMGTTGASTGVHLHFETRIHGSPVNPACFLLAGDRIAGKQTVPLTCDKPPSWQKEKEEEEDDDS